MRAQMPQACTQSLQPAPHLGHSLFGASLPPPPPPLASWVQDASGCLPRPSAPVSSLQLQHAVPRMVVAVCLTTDTPPSPCTVLPPPWGIAWGLTLGPKVRNEAEPEKSTQTQTTAAPCASLLGSGISIPSWTPFDPRSPTPDPLD